MDSLLWNVILPMQSSPQIRESLAIAYWERVAGAQAAAASKAVSARNGTLIVHTRSSVWSHELNLYKDTLLSGLNRLLGGRVITNIVFKAQGTPPPKEPAAPETPSSGELNAVILTHEENELLSQRLASLNSICDKKVRLIITSRVIQEMKLRHWRIEHLWKVCPECGSAHRSENTLCPLCIQEHPERR